MSNFIKRILRKWWVTSNLLEIYFLNKIYLRKSGWFRSRFFGLPIDGDNQPIPWFTYSSIFFLKQRVNEKLKVFEYGSGNSTLWFSKRVGTVVSVESDPFFYKIIKPRVHEIPNVQYIQITERDEYSKSIKRFDNKFDIIVIDGIERVDCFKSSMDSLSESGVFILDNSERPEIFEITDYMLNNGFKKLDFMGHGPICHYEWCTTIFYRNDNCLGI